MQKTTTMPIIAILNKSMILIALTEVSPRTATQPKVALPKPIAKRISPASTATKPPGSEVTLAAKARLDLSSLENYTRNRKILIVDDMSYTADFVKERLEKVFTVENGCTVEVETNPQIAFEKIQRSKLSDQPYDALITDLSMVQFDASGVKSGFNGDELLRRLAEADSFLPTVIYSGSWGDDIFGSFNEQLHTAIAMQEIVTGLETNSNGIPILKMKKFGRFDTDEILTAKLIATMKIGEHTDLERLETYIRNFKPSLVEIDINSKHLSKLVEITKQINLELRKVLVEIGQKDFERKDVLEERVFEAIVKTTGISYSDLSKKESDKTRFTLHAIGNCFNFINIRLYNLAQENEDFTVMHKKLEDLFELYNGYQISSKDINSGSFKINNCFHESDLEIKDDSLIISGNFDILRHITDELITNSRKAIGENPDGKVSVSTKRIKVSDTHLDVQTDLAKYGLSTNDEVAEVIVKDNGCGIEPERLEKMNRKECREGESTFGTLGWGMPYLQENISRFSGSYRVESEVGKGTEFKLYFKLTDS
jgi:signal transduction histidine kinase